MAETQKKKSARKLTVAQQVRKAQVATNNAIKRKKIADALAAFGYTKVKIATGLKLANEVEALDTKQKAIKGQQHGASSALAKSLKKAKKAYVKTLEVARVAFRGKRTARAALMLGGRRKVSTAGIIDQAGKLYKNTINTGSYLNTMKTFGYDKQKLQAEYKLFQEAAGLDDAQEGAKSSAQTATLKRDEKLKKLKRWMSDFNRIAKVALANDRQSLEALGIVAKRK